MVSADTDFATLLALRSASKPSLILFRGQGSRTPTALATLILENAARPEAALSTGRQFVGTTPYMSPEVLNGHRPTEVSNLWSLCVSLYEALTRRHPFLREDLSTTVTAITAGLTVDARTVRPDCPLALSVLLSSALSAKIEDRPRDIDTFLTLLDGVLN